MVMESKVEHSVKVQAMRELHSLSKTYTLLLKDLPFVTLLTKYHDKSLLHLGYNYSNQGCSNNQTIDKNLTYENYIDKIHESQDRIDNKTIGTNNNFNSNRNPNKIRNMDDEVGEERVRQAHM